jgi:hypothetical protein
MLLVLVTKIMLVMLLGVSSQFSNVLGVSRQFSNVIGSVKTQFTFDNVWGTEPKTFLRAESNGRHLGTKCEVSIPYSRELCS